MITYEMLRFQILAIYIISVAGKKFIEMIEIETRSYLEIEVAQIEIEQRQIYGVLIVGNVIFFVTFIIYVYVVMAEDIRERHFHTILMLIEHVTARHNTFAETQCHFTAQTVIFKGQRIQRTVYLYGSHLFSVKTCTEVHL